MPAFEDYLDMITAEIESGAVTSHKNIRAFLNDALALVEAADATRSVADDIVTSADAVQEARSDLLDEGRLAAAQAHAVDLVEHLRLLMRSADASDQARELGLD